VTFGDGIVGDVRREAILFEANTDPDTDEDGGKL